MNFSHPNGSGILFDPCEKIKIKGKSQWDQNSRLGFNTRAAILIFSQAKLIGFIVQTKMYRIE